MWFLPHLTLALLGPASENLAKFQAHFDRLQLWFFLSWGQPDKRRLYGKGRACASGEHLMRCKNHACKISYYVSFRHMLSHYTIFKNLTCSVCTPVCDAVLWSMMHAYRLRTCFIKIFCYNDLFSVVFISFQNLFSSVLDYFYASSWQKLHRK